MMFADDIVICSERRQLEIWGSALEKRGMKVCKNKTEYNCVNERVHRGEVKIQRLETTKVDEVICEKRISARVKGKMYRTVERPTISHGNDANDEKTGSRARDC